MVLHESVGREGVVIFLRVFVEGRAETERQMERTQC